MAGHLSRARQGQRMEVTANKAATYRMAVNPAPGSRYPSAVPIATTKPLGKGTAAANATPNGARFSNTVAWERSTPSSANPAVLAKRSALSDTPRFFTPCVPRDCSFTVTHRLPKKVGRPTNRTAGVSIIWNRINEFCHIPGPKPLFLCRFLHT